MCSADLTIGKETGRLFSLDYLRAGLVMLVVLHHLAVVYAANTGFYYLEPAAHDVVAVVVLVLFQLVNQAYFMGLLFLISGYFTPGSLDRKGPGWEYQEAFSAMGIGSRVFTRCGTRPLRWG